MVIVINLIVIVMVAFIAYMWSQEGLFSALIHFLCTLIAGAVALAVWEPLAYVMLGVRDDIAWSISLALPFLITLVLLRVIMDKAIPTNIKFSPVTNLVGGGVFGVGSGVLAIGFLVISMGFLRLPSDFLGYKPITYDGNGNLTRSGGLWLPADKLTVSLYERLSMSGFATSTPLAVMSPGIHEQAALMRITFDDRGRTTMTPEDFQTIGRYTVEAPTPAELFQDSQSDRPQSALNLDGDPYTPGTRLEGFVMQFQPGAKESGGQVVFGVGQVVLLYTDADGNPKRSLPVAMVTQSRDGQSNGRFRFDAEEVFLASVGAASKATMAFEFPLPAGSTADYVVVKNIRVPVDQFGTLGISGGEQGVVTTAQRDAAIDGGQILVGAAAVAVGGGDAAAGGGSVPIKLGGTRISGIDQQELHSSGVSVNNRLTAIFSKSSRGGLELNEENEIVRGENTFAPSEITNDVPASLRVDSFFTEGNTTLVQIDVSHGKRLALSNLGQAYAQTLLLTGSIQLRASGKPPYDVVGYIFKNDRGTTIKFDRANPITRYNDLPKLSASKPNDRLTLLFLVDKQRDVQIETLQLGPEPIATFAPPLPSMR